MATWNGLIATIPALMIYSMAAATAVWVTAALLNAVVFRRDSASMRHCVWGLSLGFALIAVMVAPAIIMLPLPRWGLQIVLSDTVDELPTELADASVERHAVHPNLHTDVQAETLDDVRLSPGDRKRVDSEGNDPLPRMAGGTGAGMAKELVPPAAIGGSYRSARGDMPGRKLLLAGGMVWCCGMVVVWRRKRVAHDRLRGLLRRALVIQTEKDVDFARRLAGEVGIKGSIRLSVSAETDTPFVTGWRHPHVVLPSGYGTWSDEQLRVVLLHEFIHVRRNDLMWQQIASWVELIYWFHPLAWMATRQLTIERERACDDGVIRMGRQPTDYAMHLVQVASTLRRQPQCAATLSMAASGSIQRRLNAILDPTVSRRRVGTMSTLIVCAVFAAVGLLALCVTPATGQPSSPDPARRVDTRYSQVETASRLPADGPLIQVVVKDRAAVPYDLSLDATIDQLAANGATDAAEFLKERRELAERFRREREWAYVFGRIVLEGPDNPRLVDGQMEIHRSGWFLGSVGRRDEPIEFRMAGYQTAKVVHGGAPATIVNVGEVILSPYLFDELATVRAELLFESAVKSKDVTVRVLIQHPPTNSASGGTDGFLARPRVENVAVRNRRIQKTGLSPLPHVIHIEAPGHLPLRREFDLSAGGTTDLGVLRIAASPQLSVELATADGPDFSQSEPRTLALAINEFFDTRPGGRDWVESGRLRFLEDRQDKRTFRIHCGLGGLQVTDLGKGTLGDFLGPVKHEKQPRKERGVAREGHVYLLSHSNTRWPQWTLLRVAGLPPDRTHEPDVEPSEQTDPHRGEPTPAAR